jgi:hypothetical protein
MSIAFRAPLNKQFVQMYKQHPATVFTGDCEATSPIKATFNLQTNVVPWLRVLVACLSQRRPLFAPGFVHVRCQVNNVALRRVTLEICLLCNHLLSKM